MTLGFIFSYLLVVFGFTGYALMFIKDVRHRKSLASFESDVKHIEDALRSSLTPNDNEDTAVWREIDAMIKKGKLEKSDYTYYLSTYLADDFEYIFGINYKERVKKLYSKLRYYDEINFKYWCIALKLAEKGKGFFMLDYYRFRLNFDPNDYSTSLRAARRIEQLWEAAGVPYCKLGYAFPPQRSNTDMLKPAALIYKGGPENIYPW